MRRPALCVAPRLVRRANKVVALLKRRKLTIVTAESCTGGLVAAALSQAEGASDVLEGGFVVYTKRQKSTALGVPAGELARGGAVTGAIARRMAEGALKHSKAKVAPAVTGVLGPAPDEDGNPVGLVYLACARAGRSTRILEKQLDRRSHDQLRGITVMAALGLIEDTAKRRS